MKKITYSQKLPVSLPECWNFFSTPKNLGILTPDYLGFSQNDESFTDKMYAGQIITHVLRPLLNIPMEWVTEITHVNEPHYFIDEQRFGPYKFWHHEHHFKECEHGTEIIDLVMYKVPFGVLGHLLDRFKIQKDIEAIFSYRKEKLLEIFGRYPG